VCVCHLIIFVGVFFTNNFFMAGGTADLLIGFSLQLH
jgi:hypothetical protein